MFEILNKRAVLKISGVDAQKFLQGLTTNDIINKIYSYNYLLTNQGRYLFDFFVYQESVDSYFLDVSKEDVENLTKRLNFYKLRSSVEIKNISDEYSMVYFSDKTIINSFENNVFCLKDPRYEKIGYRCLVKNSCINNLDMKIDDLYLSYKYKHAVPDGDLDLVYERSIVPEYGAEELNAVDYKKGCYVGQEVISRAKYQGVLRKKIFKLTSGQLINENLRSKKVLDKNGNDLGVVCSNYRNQMIALLREEKVNNLDDDVAIIENYQVNITVPEWRKS